MVSPASLSKSEEKETLNPRNVYHIGGLQVRFPYQPYGTQLAFMSRVISTLDRAQRDGRCHALLESPTGTGKTLSLLCSVLAWQQRYASRFPKGNSAHKRSHFTPDVTRPPSTEPSNVVEVEKPPRVPTIFYASRTHAQITQVIREYRKTAYRVPMAVLGARKRSCTNRRVQGKPNLDEICRCLIKDRNKPKCPEFIGKDDIVAHPSLQQNEVHDIEDLVKIGYAVRGCPYFAAWDMYERAQIVFCPYSYIVDQLIRQEKLEDKLNGAIIIFDEAHNMEDIAREAGSIDLGEETLFKLQSELQLLSLAIPMIYQPVCDAIDVWAAGIFSGPNNRPLNASYKTNDEYPFQDALGKSLEEICSIVPGGSLVFFPSYKLMEKLCTRWRETGQWSRLCLEKDIFIEPRGGATGEFENVLKGYYDCIGGKKRLIGRNRRAGTRVDSKKGGAFLAVSEGLDFSDDNARAVIIVGIPFPNLHDVLVGLKRSYNDTYKSSRNLLGGGEWYCQQAYRALNQAAGV
ncbi:hypothetical protein F2Q68_00019327 [Brassica cretica]|uniref:Helicase ATP-binding domain-containing protein n=1 Tax=Brassica cretica TaxID=69181 RepID=A0A8S9FMY5_BRACR|nr:hypothetical protein F2Q68_00019327 [Brassica cretica]